MLTGYGGALNPLASLVDSTNELFAENKGWNLTRFALMAAAERLFAGAGGSHNFRRYNKRLPEGN